MDAAELAEAVRLSAEHLQEAAEAERQRRVDAGIEDDVEDEQPLASPPMTMDALGGKLLEVCGGLYYDENDARTAGPHAYSYTRGRPRGRPGPARI